MSDTFEAELEAARVAEEGFSATEAPEGEVAEVETVDLDAEAFARQATTIKEQSKRLLVAEMQIRRYVAKYGLLED